MTPITIDDHTLIPYPPDWTHPVDHTLSLGTHIADSLTGHEERAIFHNKPQKSIRYNITSSDISQAFSIQHTLEKALKSTQAAVPIWGRHHRIIAADQKTIVLENPAHTLHTNQPILATNAYGHMKALARIETIDSNTLTLDKALGLLPNDCLVPLLFGRLEDVSVKSLSSNTRTFTIHFTEIEPIRDINAPFIFTALDPQQSGCVSSAEDLYIIIYVQENMSYCGHLANLEKNIVNLRDHLRKHIYKGNTALMNQFVKIRYCHAAWLGCISLKTLYEIVPRYIVLIFMNSSHFYAGIKYQNDPTFRYLSDYANFTAEYKRRTFFRCKVYSMQIDPNSKDFNDGTFIKKKHRSFNHHLKMAINGLGSYAKIGPPLSAMHVDYALDIDSKTPTETYLNDILHMMNTP